MASLGLPMMGNFIAEFLILIDAYEVNPTLAIISSVGLVFAALYSLRMIQRVFLGPIQPASHVSDVNAREYLVLISLSVAIVILGLYPQPVLDSVKEVVQSLMHKNTPV
jgi:NADH-quinone oxidoreductase subunit M